LSDEFFAATKDSRIGGSAVLAGLANLARACIIGTRPSIDSAAFALSVILDQHSEDLDDRRVTTGDTYVLMASGYDDLASAVRFIANGGPAEQAVTIIAALEKLTPAHLYGH
jgi:hypothetical protein